MSRHLLIRDRLQKQIVAQSHVACKTVSLRTDFSYAAKNVKVDVVLCVTRSEPSKV